MCGVLLAYIYHFKPLVFVALGRRSYFLLAGSIVGLFWAYFAQNYEFLRRTAGYSVIALSFSCLLLLIYNKSGFLSRKLWYRLIAWVGVYSYGIYLWHTLALEPGRRIIAIAEGSIIPPSIIWIFVLIVQFSIGITLGWIMTKAVEWPALRFRDKYFPAKPKSKSLVRAEVL